MGTGIVTALTSLNEDKRQPEVILVPADFSTLPQANSKSGKTYIAGANVTDNDPIKTNTGQSFLAGQVFFWDKNSQTYIVQATSLDVRTGIGTGLIWGGELSVNIADNTKFDWAAGAAQFEDSYTDPPNPTSKIIYWDTQEGITVTGIAVQLTTAVSLDSNGNLIQGASPPPPEELKEEIYLGILVHPNLTTLTSAVSTPGVWVRDIMQTVGNLYGSLGFTVNEAGNFFYANGANRKINKTEGRTGANAINYGNSKKDPNRITRAEKIAPYFFTLYRNTPIPTLSFVDEIPVDKYDPNGDGTLVDIPDNHFATHRIYYEPTIDIIIMQYAQFAYDTQKKAATSWEQEDFDKESTIRNTPLRTILAVQKNCSALNDLDCAKFIEMGAFGDYDFRTINNFSRFSNSSPIIDGMTNQRQAISFYDDGGTLYADIAAVFNFERDDISFAAVDSSINTVGGDFDNGTMIAGDRIIVSDSTNNNGIFTVVSVASLKIIVSETIIDEVAGSDITIETNGINDITFSFGGKEYILDCTTGDGRNGRARIALANGSDTAPQENWAYAIRSGDEAILQQAIVEPSKDFSMMFSALIPSVASSIADGFYNSRRWTDTKDIGGRGAVATLLSKQRDTTPYRSGLLPTITIDTGPTPDDVNFTMGTGIVREIYNQNVNALDLNLSGALIVNDFTTPYKKITGINEIDVDASNNTLNNKYFQIILAVSLNADGSVDRLLINLPNGSYISAASAFNDTSGYSNTSFPGEFKSIYLLCAAVLRLQGGNSWTNVAISEGGVNNIDLRGQSLGVRSSGSGTAAITSFSDGSFAVFNDADNTRIVNVSVANVDTLTTRTITIANRDLDLANPVFDNTDILGNLTVGLSHSIAGDSSVAFGNNNTIGAQADYSLATGEDNNVSARYGVSTGWSNTVDSYGLMVLGRLSAATGGSLASWTETDPIFVCGNGPGATHNSFTILKNGNTNIAALTGEDSWISITTDVTHKATLKLGDTADDDIGYVEYDNNTDTMYIATDAAVRITVGSGANGHILMEPSSNGKVWAKGTPGSPITTGSTMTNGSFRMGTNSANDYALDFGIYDSTPYGAWIRAVDSSDLSVVDAPLAINPSGGKIVMGYNIAPLSNTGKLNLRGTDSSITTGPHFHAYTSSSDTHPVYQQVNWSSSVIYHVYGGYYNGGFIIRSNAGSVFQVLFTSNDYRIAFAGSGTIGTTTSMSNALIIDNDGTVRLGPAGDFRVDSSGIVRVGPSLYGAVSNSTASYQSRIIHGRINSGGTKLSGHGFTSSKDSTGVYSITYSSSFSTEVPTAQAAGWDTAVGGGSTDNWFTVISEITSSCKVVSRNTIGVLEDADFSIQIIGRQ